MMPTFRLVSSHSEAANDFQSGNKLVSQEKVNHLFSRVCATKKKKTNWFGIRMCSSVDLLTSF